MQYNEVVRCRVMAGGLVLRREEGMYVEGEEHYLCVVGLTVLWAPAVSYWAFHSVLGAARPSSSLFRVCLHATLVHSRH
jgi:hypothetical protein